jgi:hypothetical protein
VAALIVLAVFASAAVYLALTATVFAPADHVYDEGFVDFLRQDGAKLSAHSWHGGHDGAYWSRHWPTYLRFYANALASC